MAIVKMKKLRVMAMADSRDGLLRELLRKETLVVAGELITTMLKDSESDTYCSYCLCYWGST